MVEFPTLQNVDDNNDAVVHALTKTTTSSSFILGDDLSCSLSSLFEDEEFHDEQFFEPCSKVMESSTYEEEDSQLPPAGTTSSSHCVKVTHWALRVFMTASGKQKLTNHHHPKSSPSSRFLRHHHHSIVQEHPQKINQSCCSSSSTSVSTTTTTTTTASLSLPFSFPCKKKKLTLIHMMDTSYHEEDPVYDENDFQRAMNQVDPLAQELEQAANLDRERMSNMSMQTTRHHLKQPTKDQSDNNNASSTLLEEEDGNQPIAAIGTDDDDGDDTTIKGTGTARVSSPPQRSKIKRVTWDPASFHPKKEEETNPPFVQEPGFRNSKSNPPLVSLTNIMIVPSGNFKEPGFQNSNTNNNCNNKCESNNESKESECGNRETWLHLDATGPFQFGSDFSWLTDPWQSSDPENSNSVSFWSLSSPTRRDPEAEENHRREYDDDNASRRDDLEDNDKDETESIITASMLKELESVTLYLERYERTKKESQREKQKNQIMFTEKNDSSTVPLPWIHSRSAAVHQHAPRENIDSDECAPQLDDSCSGLIPYIGSVSSVPSDVDDEERFSNYNDADDDMSQRLGIRRYVVEKPKIIPLAWSREHRNPAVPNEKVQQESVVGPGITSSIHRQSGSFHQVHVQEDSNNHINLLRQTASHPKPQHLYQSLQTTMISNKDSMNESLEMRNSIHRGVADLWNCHRQASSHTTGIEHANLSRNVSERSYCKKSKLPSRGFHGSSRPNANTRSTTTTRLQMEPFLCPR
jgi:hypothetical protein